MTNRPTRKTTKKGTREFTAYAIFDGDSLACWDYRLPITWYKFTAQGDAKRYGAPESVIRKVRIIVEEQHE